MYDARTLVRTLPFIIALLFALGCATAGGDDDDDGNNRRVDAGPIANIDAAPVADAAPMPDAAEVMTDAGPGGGGMCSDHDDCTAPGECCFVIQCVEGAVIGGQCFPI